MAKAQIKQDTAMEKKTAIITSLAAAGLLGISAVATVSILNELNNSHSVSQDSLALTSSGLNDLGTFESQLPELPQVSDLPLTKQLAATANSSDQSLVNISMATAEQLVVAATNGTLQRSVETTRKGISAFAITVLRSDKSIVTGYVDKASGTIFDWEIVKAGVAATGDNKYDDDDDDDRYDDDDKYDDDDDDEYDDDDD